MEYFILNEGVRQGPFDLVSMMKKVRNNAVTSTTMVSEGVDGPYLEAINIEEIAQLINEHTNPDAGSAGSGDIKMTLAACFHEGVELWARRILDYTLFAGIIIAVGFSLRAIFSPIFGSGHVIPSYISSVLVMAAFFIFFYYVLETKRNQRIEKPELIAVIKRCFGPFLGLSAILSLFVLGFGISSNFGLFMTLITIIAMTFLVFTPFIATDSNMGVGRAARLSYQKVVSIGADNFGVILAIVSINVFAAFLPGLLLKDLLGLGLFISLPVTISALAYIYDQIFA